LLGDAKSSLGDAESSLGDATSSLGDAKSSLSDAESSLGDAKSSLSDAESSLGDAKNSLGRDAKDTKSLLCYVQARGAGRAHPFAHRRGQRARQAAVAEALHRAAGKADWAGMAGKRVRKWCTEQVIEWERQHTPATSGRG
jgi:hypothetical protein